MRNSDGCCSSRWGRTARSSSPTGFPMKSCSGLATSSNGSRKWGCPTACIDSISKRPVSPAAVAGILQVGRHHRRTDPRTGARFQPLRSGRKRASRGIPDPRQQSSAERARRQQVRKSRHKSKAPERDARDKPGSGAGRSWSIRKELTMSHCPYCSGALEQVDVDAGKCLVCGKTLPKGMVLAPPMDEAGASTHDERRIAATMEVPLPEPEDADSLTPATHVDQRIVATFMPAPTPETHIEQPRPPGGLTHDDQIAATMMVSPAPEAPRRPRCPASRPLRRARSRTAIVSPPPSTWMRCRAKGRRTSPLPCGKARSIRVAIRGPRSGGVEGRRTTNRTWSSSLASCATPAPLAACPPITSCWASSAKEAWG